MQSKIKWIFLLLVVALFSFALASCKPKADGESKKESVFSETVLDGEKDSQLAESQSDSQSLNESQSVINSESLVASESENAESKTDGESKTESENAKESQSEIESNFNESESQFESEPESETSSEIESETNSEEESQESSSEETQIIITVSGWTVELGDFTKTLCYGEPVAVSQVVKDSGVTVSTSKLKISTVVDGKTVQISSTAKIESSCEIFIEDGRTYVTVVATDENGAQKRVYLLLGIRTYRAETAIADAGFSFDDLYWEITRTSSGVAKTEPLTNSQTALRDGDVLTGKILGAVRVIFDCSNYGVLNIGNGGYELDYSKGSTWNNPQIALTDSVSKALKFECWSLNKRAIGGLSGAQAVTSVEQIFAQKLEEVTVYPVFSVNYANLQGWFKIEEQNAYAQIIGEEVYFHGDGIETSGALKLSCKGGEVYFKLDASLSSDEKSEFRLNFDQRPTGAIIKIRVDDPSGSTIYLCEGKGQFDAFLSRADLVLRSLNCDGYSVTPEQIENGKYYVVYFSYYTYP